MSPFEMVYRLIARLALPRRWRSDHGEERAADSERRLRDHAGIQIPLVQRAVP